jgi:uncharacterized protein (DUF2141 family)
MNRHSTLIRPLALAAQLLLLPMAAHAFDLTLEVLNPKVVQGSINAALYNSAETWLKQDLAVGAQRVPAAEKTVIVYRGLPAGAYAISLFHDENGNGKLDTNVVGLPTERYGFSRDARGRMGPPAYADAVFELQADTTVAITLK